MFLYNDVHTRTADVVLALFLPSVREAEDVGPHEPSVAHAAGEVGVRRLRKAPNHRTLKRSEGEITGVLQRLVSTFEQVYLLGSFMITNDRSPVTGRPSNSRKHLNDD